MTKKFSIIVLFLLFLFACQQHNLQFVQIKGFTQGSTYAVSYYSVDGKNWQHEIDSILQVIDNSLSIYNKNSIISKVNSDDTTVMLDNHFINVFNTSKLIAEKSHGAFDYTVGPLVNAWGFGFKQKIKLSKQQVDSLLHFVDFRNVEISNGAIKKKSPSTQIDFNAIAQGYTADVISDFLSKQGIENHLVEIGGEVVAKGKKIDGSSWNIGIEKPVDNNENEIRILQATVQLENRAIATSGNYRKFYIEDGIKYSHTIDPKSGFPVKHNLLSATVFAKTGAMADALATACMVVGKDSCIQLMKQFEDIDIYLIYTDSTGKYATYCSPTLAPKIKNID